MLVTRCQIIRLICTQTPLGEAYSAFSAGFQGAFCGEEGNTKGREGKHRRGRDTRRD